MSSSLLIGIISCLFLPIDSLLMLSLKRIGFPSLSHFPLESGLATSHSKTDFCDSATVRSTSGLLMAPPIKAKWKRKKVINLKEKLMSTLLSSISLEFL